MENDSIQKNVSDLLKKLLATHDKCEWLPSGGHLPNLIFSLHMKNHIIQASMKAIGVFIKNNEVNNSILKYEVGVSGGKNRELVVEIAQNLANLYSRNCEMAQKKKSETVLYIIDELNAMS